MDLVPDEIADAVARRMEPVPAPPAPQLVAGQVDVTLRGSLAPQIGPVAGDIFDVFEQATRSESGHPLPDPDVPGVFDPARAEAFCRALVEELAARGAGRPVAFDVPMWPEERIPRLPGIALAVEVSFIPRTGEPPRTARALLGEPTEG